MNKTLLRLKEKVKSHSRKKKDKLFYSFCTDNCKILDVGVSSEIDPHHTDISSNHFLKGFRFPDEYYTGLGIEPMDGLSMAYPKKSFIQYDGNVFPFDDDTFEWSYSNAVIEHVGDYASKLNFIKEMARVSKKVYFTTPNKYFPVDAHTLSFFIHWNDKLFYRYRLRKKFWLPQSSLNLVSKRELKKLLRDVGIENYKLIKNRFLGLVMNFVVVI